MALRRNCCRRVRQPAPRFSEERLKELIKQAGEAAKLPPAGFSDPQRVSTDEGPAVQLTLDDAVQFALDRNLDIKVQRLNPELQDIAAGERAGVLQPDHRFVVQPIQPGRHARATSCRSSAGGRGVTARADGKYNGSVTQNVGWGGGLLSATLNNNRSQSDSNNSLFNPQKNATWNFNYTQPLFRDFKVDAQRRMLQVTRVIAISPTCSCAPR